MYTAYFGDMKLLSLLLILALTGSQRPPRAPAPSILGTWKLQAVQLVYQRPDGTPPYRKPAHITAGVTTETFTKDGRWIERQYDTRLDEGTYRMERGLLFINCGQDHRQEQIQELTVTRLVRTSKKEEGNGLQLEAIVTFGRLPRNDTVEGTASLLQSAPKQGIENVPKTGIFSGV